MIFVDSRYSDSAVVNLEGIRGSQKTIVSGAQVDFTVNYIIHQITDAERCETLAFDFYGDDTRWWVIADANPEILDWSNIPNGTLIRIPSI